MEENEKEYYKKVNWTINYGRELLSGKDMLIPKEGISMARYLKIRNVYEFSKSLCLSEKCKLDENSFNLLIHVFMHTEKFILNLGNSSEFFRLNVDSSEISIANRFTNYFSFMNRDPVSDIRKDLEEKRSSGQSLRCPVCDQHVKEYKKSLSSNSARFLFSLVSVSKTKPNGWVHYSDCIYNSRNYPEVAYWNLAHTRKDETKEKKTSGFWKPTKLGIDFVMNKAKIPKYVHVYNAKVVKIDETEKVSIVDCFGNKFNYEELMKKF